MNGMLERLGLFVTRHRWWVLGVWLLVLLGAIGANRAAEPAPEPDLARVSD